ncbi:2'-5' RNA ligase family protein [Streptomyces sp. NPDC058861]|uniref:2'-5' RNA ligase family protein n=1 Tax=Streptomyces sp. NPDC058861 TaxID=3346653 RepID=UPI0036BFC37C
MLVEDRDGSRRTCTLTTTLDVHKPFQPKAGASPWPPGSTLLHVYAVPDWSDPHHQELLDLVTGISKVLDAAKVPIRPVPRRWLHLTIDQIAVPTASISQEDRDRLIAELRSRLAALPPVEVQIGSALSYPTGVICDVHPDKELAAMHAVVQDVVRDVLGAEAATYPWSPPHLTLGYAHAETDNDALQRRLRRVRPSHATLRLNALDLVDVSANTGGSAPTITWHEVASLPLHTGPAS